MKKILITGIIVLIVGVIVTAFFFLSFMTDPVPPQVRAGWYLPRQDIVWTPSGPDSPHSTQERLILTGHQDVSAPQFPALSPYSRYENYTHLTTNDQYMIAVWYFNEERKFLESQTKLVDFLETSGKISSVELQFTDYFTRSGKLVPGNEDVQNRYTLPGSIDAAGYESADTSGCFFTVTMPGPKMPSQAGNYGADKEFYIVYYGITTPANLTSHIPFLQDMIAETFRYDHMPSVGTLT